MVVCSLKAGLRTTEVPSHELPRRHGASNLNAMRDRTRVLATLLRRRVSRYPGRLHNPWGARGQEMIVLANRAAAASSPASPSSDARGRASRSPAA